MSELEKFSTQYFNAAPAPLDGEEDPKIRQLISTRVFMVLKRKYTPRNLRFFTLYQDLYDVQMGARREIPRNIYRFLIIMVKRLTKMLSSKEVAGDFSVKVDRLLLLLKRYDEDRTQTILIRQIAQAYAEAIQILAEDAGSPLNMIRMPGKSGFYRFKKMNPREQKLMMLQRTDPEMFEQLQKNEEVVKRVRERTKQMMEAQGLRPKQKRVRGRFVLTGEDPVTGEETVFTDEGESLPIETFIEREERRQEAIKRLSRFEKVRGRGEAVKPEDLGMTRDELNEVRQNLARTHTRIFLTDINELRAMSDEEVEKLTRGPVETIALTDDSGKRHSLTRIYEVRKAVDGRKVVVSGRFKGYYVDELVNASGRLIEGTAYDYNPSKGQTTPVPLERRRKDGSVELRINAAREPYITLDENGDFMMMLPRTHDWSDIRNNVDRLELVSESFRPVKTVPVVENGEVREVQTRKALYKFAAEDFSMVRDLIGGCALSQAAVEKLDSYYRTLTEQQAVESERVTKLYSTSHIGGFREHVEFRGVQKEAMAWCEARDWTGVIAMGTGTGKTAATIGIILKMIKDGKAKEGNGRFLYVCPAKLVGNLPKEISCFCENPSEVLELVDVVSYDEYLIRFKQDPTFSDDYVRVFFDEAQKRLMRKNDTSIAVAKSKAKKIIMTASPMEKFPQDAYMLASIANGDNIFETNPKGEDQTDVYVHEYVETKRKWKRRFTEAVGRRIMGLRNDPATKRSFHEWAKKNIFVKRAQDLPEVYMPELRRQTEAVTMPDEVEDAYREEVAKIQDIMESLIRKYRDLEKDGLHAQVDSYQAITGELGEVYKTLKVLADRPGDIIPGAGYPKIDRAVEIIDEKVEEGRRTLMFTDSPDMARITVKKMSERFPGRRHAVGLAEGIEVWLDGTIETSYARKAYVDNQGILQPEEDWAVVVLKNFVSQDPGVLTLTLTSAYSTGQNLQAFDCVIHLDRDSWNSEEMKQRTARSWRTGQRNTVDEYTLDAVYSTTQSDTDVTLDEIRKYIQEIDEKLFDDMIIESQQVSLGEDYTGIKKYDASMISLNRRYMDQALSPRAQSLGEVAYSDRTR